MESIMQWDMDPRLEKLWHIHCLEMQAASLAARTFLRDQSGVLVLLQLVNTTAVA